METTVENGITYTYDKFEIAEKINQTINKIEKIIKENDYQVTGNINQYLNLDEKKWVHLSKKQMKKIQKYCFWIDKNPTLRRINTLFSLLSRLFELEKVRVKVSLKEETIQKARKEWLKARDESERLLKIYKDEKGDFYKNKMNFFTKK